MGGSRCCTVYVHVPALSSFVLTCVSLFIYLFYFFLILSPRVILLFPERENALQLSVVRTWEKACPVGRRGSSSHHASGLSLRHEHGRVVAPVISFLNWWGWSRQTTPEEVELAFMQRLKGGCGSTVIKGCGAWRTRLKSPQCGSWCKGDTIIFFLSLLEALSGI